MMTGEIRVLYVDDEPMLLEISKLFLEKEGVLVVDTLISAKEALIRLNTVQYDAIISDYQMPEMDGIRFLKALRTKGNTIPFIIFTGRGREEIVIEALNNGADFYLQKGGDPESQFTELTHKIRQAVQQKRAEASIRDHERREADIINFLPDATFAIDTNGVVIAWNRAMEKMTGVKLSEILGKDNYEYAIPLYHERRPILIDLVLKDDPVTAGKYPTIIREGTTLFSEITIPHFNNGRGAALWFTASPLYDTRGTVIGAIESIREITMRKRAEEALRESERKYRTVFETTGTSTVLLENDGTISLANSEFERLSGYPKDEIENNKKWSEFVVKEDLERMLTQHRNRRQDRQSALTQYEFRFMSRSGDVRDIYLTVDIIPGTTKSVASLLDITDRKRAEENLIAANNEYIGLLNQIQDVYYRSDTEGRLIKASQSWATLLGYEDIPECLGRSIANDFYLDPADRKPFLEEVYRNGKVADYEIQLKRKDGMPVPVATSSHLYYDPAGNILGVEGTFRDITERKQQEQILRTQLNLGLALQSIRGMEETLDICLNAAIEISGLDSGGIYLVDEKSGSLDLIVSRNLADEFVKSVSHYTTGSVNAEMVMAGKPIYVQFSKIGIVPSPIQEREGLQAAALIPILSSNRVIACLNITSHTVDEIPATARIGLETIATQIGTAIERVRAEEALTDSEQKYRNVVEDQTEFISRFLPDGTHIFVNEAYLRYFGLKRDEILGYRFRPNISAEDEERIQRFFESLTPDNPVDIIEHRIIMPDGGIRWQRWSDRAIFDPSGTVTEYQSVGRDITERKQVEEALRESEEKYRTLVEKANEGIIIAQDGLFVFANRRMSELLGVPAADLEGKPFIDFVWPDDRELVNANYRKRITGETVNNTYDFRVIGAGGRSAWVFLSAAAIQWKGKPATLNLVTDITGRKLVEKELISTQALLNATLDSIPDIIGIQNIDHTIIRYNRAGYEFLYLTPEEVHGRRCYELIGRTIPCEECATEKAIKSKRMERSERYLPEYDIHLDCRSNPVLDENGEIVFIVEQLQDITERKRTEEVLHQTNKKLTLLSSITRHDIDNQLSALFGYLRILEKKQSDPSFNEYFRKIASAAQRMSSMIQFTREYEKIGDNAPVWEDCRILVDIAAKESPLGQIMVKNDLPAGTEVFADPLFVKVLYNLMDNAVRYGGKITTIRFSAEESTDDHLIVCEDDGDGVPAEDKEKIFERGFGKNTGLGLFLAREILAITGITIKENGEPGKGARFEITVPRRAYRFKKDT